MEKKYQIIYADPPWFYHYKASKKWGDAQVEYPVMKTKDICSLPVADITEDRAVCFMWATMPNLPEAFKVMEAWGFKYKTVAFVWVKTTSKGGYRSGTGYFTNSNAELVLIGTKGNNLERKRKDIKQILATPIIGHSVKPQQIRERIEALYGDIPGS
jgi:N6-adenosine-specific RNA methylase IME4